MIILYGYVDSSISPKKARMVAHVNRLFGKPRIRFSVGSVHIAYDGIFSRGESFADAADNWIKIASRDDRGTFEFMTTDGTIIFYLTDPL